MQRPIKGELCEVNLSEQQVDSCLVDVLSWSDGRQLALLEEFCIFSLKRKTRSQARSEFYTRFPRAETLGLQSHPLTRFHTVRGHSREWNLFELTWGKRWTTVEPAWNVCQIIIGFSMGHWKTMDPMFNCRKIAIWNQTFPMALLFKYKSNKIVTQRSVDSRSCYRHGNILRLLTGR